MVLTPTTQKIAPKSANKIKNQSVTSDSSVTSSTTNSNGGKASISCRRKIAFHPTHGYAITPPLPLKVARRNQRERNRVKQVNCGFEMLRAHIPSAAKQKKMSKVDTLRHAVEYIQNLQVMLNEKKSSSNLENGFLTHESEVSSNGPSIPGVVPPGHYPLTPQTPTTSMPFPPMTGGNESGYDTASSFYSSTPDPHQTGSGDLMSPLPPNHQYGCNSPVSSNYDYHNYPQHHQMTTINHQYYASNEANSEEDELLDVIAKWQDN